MPRPFAGVLSRCRLTICPHGFIGPDSRKEGRQGGAEEATSKARILGWKEELAEDEQSL